MTVRYTDREMALLREAHEVEQILGKVLGYPRYGPDMFEDGVPDGSVCVADHTPVTLAMTAADRIRELERRGTPRSEEEVDDMPQPT